MNEFQSPAEYEANADDLAEAIAKLIPVHPSILRMENPDELRRVGVNFLPHITWAQRRYALNKAKKLNQASVAYE